MDEELSAEGMQGKEISELDIYKNKAVRDYTREVYQNLMSVVEALEAKSPLPMTQKQIAEITSLSKSKVFDICWNLAKRGWAEDAGDGAIRLKKGTSEKEAFIGRMVVRLVKDSYGINLESE